ncbi:hypothetical protein GEMRC1_003175 [Eukaryota sp. GEM-RC1]
MSSSWQFLIPVRLELEHEDNRLVDCFLWNPSDADPFQFATQLVSDMNLPQSFIPLIIESINIQCSPDHYPPFKLSVDSPGECRILIKLDIAIGTTHFKDQFELDINNPLNNPEDIAQRIVFDLGLSPIFVTAISHSIREQIGRVMMLIKHQRLSEAPILPSPILGAPYRWTVELPSWTPKVEAINSAEEAPVVMPPSGQGREISKDDSTSSLLSSVTPSSSVDLSKSRLALDSRKYNLGPQGPLFPHELVEKVEKGETALDVAMEFQVTLPTIRKRMDQAGVPREKWFNVPCTKEIIDALDPVKPDGSAETVSIPLSIIQEVGAKFSLAETEVLAIYNDTVIDHGWILPDELFMKFHATNTPLIAIADAVKIPLKSLKRYIKAAKLLPEEVIKSSPHYRVKFWDTSDIEYLFAKGYNVYQVADVMGHTVADVNRSKAQLGL